MEANLERERACANRLGAALSAQPAVAIAHASGAPLFARGLKYGFRGSRGVRESNEVQRLMQEKAQLKKKLTQSEAELEKWKYQPEAAMADACEEVLSKKI